MTPRNADEPLQPSAPVRRPLPPPEGAQISLDFLFGITLFLFTFTYVALFIPGLFAPFDTESDVTTLQGDKAAIWLTEEKLVDDRSEPGIVNMSKLQTFMAELGGTNSQRTVLRQEAGLVSSIRTLDLNVSVDYLNGTAAGGVVCASSPNTCAAGNVTRSDLPVGQTKRVVKLVNTSLNESGMASHVVIHQIYPSTTVDSLILFNPLKDPVSLENWILGDGEQNVTFPSGTYIAPRGYLAVARTVNLAYTDGCVPDLEMPTGFNNTNVPDMVNMTGGTFLLAAAGDEVCLFNGTALVDGVAYGGAPLPRDCTVGVGPNLDTGPAVPPPGAASIARINPGVEGSETSETSENWASAFGLAFPALCSPPTSAIISIRVW